MHPRPIHRSEVMSTYTQPKIESLKKNKNLIDLSKLILSDEKFKRGSFIRVMLNNDNV